MALLAATLVAACGRTPDLSGPERVRTVAVDPAPRDLAAPARERAIARWVAVVTWNARAVWNYAVAVRFAVAVERTQRTGSVGHRGPANADPVTGRCGGDLPPCSVMMCESRGDPQAENPRSSASGLWQILDSTWNGFGGYAHAADAPVSVQNEKARQIYAGGAGRFQWSC